MLPTAEHRAIIQYTILFSQCRRDHVSAAINSQCQLAADHKSTRVSLVLILSKLLCNSLSTGQIWSDWMQDSSEDRSFHTVITAQGTATHWQARIHYYWFKKVHACNNRTPFLPDTNAIHCSHMPHAHIHLCMLTLMHMSYVCITFVYICKKTCFAE